jgi:hypothetical protein
MTRYRKHSAGTDGWSAEVYPVMHKPYRMACCECGLVHDIRFKVNRVTARHTGGSFDCEELDPEEYRVSMQVRRNNRSTAQLRRHRTITLR